MNEADSFFQFLKYLDKESNGYTTTDYVRNLNVSQLKHLVELFHPNDISNTDRLEYGHIDVENIRLVFDINSRLPYTPIRNVPFLGVSFSDRKLGCILW